MCIRDSVYTARKFFNSIIPPVGIYQNQKVEAMIAYGPNGYDYAPFKQLEGLHILPGVSTYCDITHADATKATGIQAVSYTHLNPKSLNALTM